MRFPENATKPMPKVSEFFRCHLQATAIASDAAGLRRRCCEARVRFGPRVTAEIRPVAGPQTE
jgi:hypothetical protein